MELIRSKSKIIPGFAVAALIALCARYIEGLMPIHLVGASVISLFIGMAINSFWNPDILQEGLKFTSKKILKFAIILLGASLSVNTILTVGKISLSAIAAIAPVIDAEDKEIAYAMSATFLFDMAMIVLFPIMGHWLGLSDMAYGLWAGTAVNDTSSVVAAGYAFSESAGDFATMVKLTRTLSIIPAVIIFALINIRLKQKSQLCSDGKADESLSGKVNFISLFPWFILGFVGLSVVNSMGFIPAAASGAAKELSKFLMVAALAAIGLNTSFKDMKKAGFAPMLHGFIVSVLVVIVAIAVEWGMGID